MQEYSSDSSDILFFVPIFIFVLKNVSKYTRQFRKFLYNIIPIKFKSLSNEIPIKTEKM